MTYLVIPSAENFNETEKLIREHDTALEYNDFFEPSVYENEEETERLIRFYTSLDRDRSRDTLHGAFLGLDITSADTVIRERSQSLFRRSAYIASRLGVKGVVFHSGIISGLGESYENRWLEQASAFLHKLCGEFPETEIYLENTFEQEPFLLSKTAGMLSDVSNFGLCLDYAHAVLTKTPAEVWVREFAPYIRHIHINDNDLKSDRHLALGEGSIDFSEFMMLLEKYKIDTSVLIEVSGSEKAERSLGYIAKIKHERNDKKECVSKQEKTGIFETNSDDDILGKILDIGIALTAERDEDKLFDYIVDTAMMLTGSDGGTLYIPENDKLVFRIMKTRSKNISFGGNGKRPDVPPVPLRMENICAYSVLTGRSLNIADVYDCSEFDFSGPKTYDSINCYRTKSMVVIPLMNKENEAIGVLQLINAQTDGIVRSFTQDEERIIHSLGSQTAIALSNMNYVKELKKQMWSFTEAMTDAIDKRTPYNATHTKKVAEYAQMIALHINELHDLGKEENYFSRERLDCLKMAALLHDVGKVGVSGKIMNKPSRLGYEADMGENKDNRLFNRFEIIDLKAQIAFLKGKISSGEFENISEQTDICRKLVSYINKAEFLEEADEKKLSEVFGYCFECDGERTEFFTEDERRKLLIKKGTLTDAERREMEKHVEMTESILSKVHFNSYFKDVKKWAEDHHELLNGKGYPKHLTAEQLCLETRIITVADICDALLATDRPYKRPKSLEDTFRILHYNAEKGEIDGKIVDYLEECLTAKKDENL